MRIEIDARVLELFPQMSVCGLVCNLMDISDLPPEPILEFNKPSDEEAQNIITLWKNFYKQFPHDKKARPSIEYLTQASLKGNLGKIHTLVDLYNEASLLALAPFGGEDLKTMGSSLTLTFAEGTEPFQPLGKEEFQTPKNGELIWKDFHNRVVCRSLNWLESNIHKIQPETTYIGFFSERPLNLFPSPQKGMDFLEQTLSHWGISCENFLLNQDTPRKILD